MKHRFLATLSFMLLSLLSSNLLALPVPHQVIQGDVNTQDLLGTGMIVQQKSEKAIVNWQNFNIAPHENVHFQQPTYGVCLNRIDAANGMSQIAGQLSSTGTIYLINQAGILFSDTARVNVVGLVASTADLADQNFLNDTKHTFASPTTQHGAIINKGLINIFSNGNVALLGNSVSNQGVIIANYGKLQLKAGSTFVVDFNGDGVINFATDLVMPEATALPGKDENGNNLQHAIDNTGKIISEGGEVIIMANAVPQIFDSLINMSGEIQAKAVMQTNNGVILVGNDNGAVNVTGKIDVTGVDDNTMSGNIVMVSDTITLAENSIIPNANDAGSGWLSLGDTAGKVKTFSLDLEQTPYAGTYKTVSRETLIPVHETAKAIRNYYDYKKHVEITFPIVDIYIDQSDAIRKPVSIDTSYNGININLRSITEEDHEMVQTYLNSQPLVREKFAHGKTVDADYTQARVKVLSDRFNTDVTDGCFMHGGFIITDSDTNDFLGMINSGTSDDKGITEMAYLSRPDAWSHKPANLATDYVLPEGELLQKDYSGLATAAVNALMEYSERLAQEQYTIKGEPITAMRAVTRVNNNGWRVLAKNDFDITAITAIPAWGPELRYQLEYHY